MKLEYLKNKMIYKVMLYIIFAIILILTIRNKASFHIDEVYSYGLANHKFADTIKMTPIEGKTYIPAEGAYLEYMTVKEGERFSYDNVWKSQSADVHPPLYYTILHTICSFFPGSFSIWYAGAINIIFALMTLCVVRKLVWALMQDEKMKLIITAAFMTTAGFLNVFAFFRMYVMAMFWVTLLTYLFVIKVKDANIFGGGGGTLPFAQVPFAEH